MEIDIFPLPSTKGVHRYIGTTFLGLIIITYIVGAYKVAQLFVGEDKELLCFLVTIPIFIGGYAIKLLVQCNGIVNGVSVKIEKNKLKQADLKNLVWNIGYQFNIDSEVQALFMLNLFHAWFKNTEKETIRKTLRNTNGNYSIKIDEDIIEHLLELEEKVLCKKHK